MGLFLKCSAGVLVAVVLILVMLFTNNPKLRQFFNQFKTHNMRGKEAE